MKPSLPQRPNPVLTRVKPSRITQVQPLHGSAQIRLRGLGDEMVMRVHQRIRVQADTELLMDVPQQLKEMLAVPTVSENATPLRAPMNGAPCQARC